MSDGHIDRLDRATRPQRTSDNAAVQHDIRGGTTFGVDRRMFAAEECLRAPHGWRTQKQSQVRSEAETSRVRDTLSVHQHDVRLRYERRARLEHYRRLTE